MLLAEVVAAADAVAATTSRTAKRDLIAALLRAAEPHEVGTVARLLAGDPEQGRIGIGWATLARVEVAPAPASSLAVADLDSALDEVAALVGAGSATARRERLGRLMAGATAAEQFFIRRLLIGELRQGALEAAVADAVAAAFDVPQADVRRALMLSGDLGRTAEVARTRGRAGLAGVSLTVGRPLQPMLASPGEDIGAAVAAVAGPGDGRAPVAVEWKLDGARVQIHRDGDEVGVFTRNLNDVTGRLPGVVATALELPVGRFVVDGEVLGVDPDARPELFQDTMRRLGRRSGAGAGASPVGDSAAGSAPARDASRAGDSAASRAGHSAASRVGDAGPAPGGPAAGAVGLRPWLFDVLHIAGDDLLDRPLAERRAALAELAPAHRVPGIVTADAAEADAFLRGALQAGHEGVVVKDLASPYAAGRRGAAWRKVKPVHLLDLVVLAVEEGSGRRRGWLSNLHLGARDSDGGFVMVGKTFKGLTDELLAWQSAELLARETGRERHVVHVRPELVVEIALDGVQRSTRYPGGVALRFARVRRYRSDKTAAEADLIDTVRSLLPRSG